MEISNRHADNRNKLIAVISQIMVLLAYLGLAAEPVAAQVHSAEDRAYMSITFDGVWFFSTSSETIRIRVEQDGLSVLVDESAYFKGATVTDIHREENTITFEYEDRQLSLTRIAGTDLIKLGSDTGILRGEKLRRLSSQDHEVLDIWFNFEPGPCGNFNQFCEEQY